MKISTKVQYGLRAMAYLAGLENRQIPVAAKDIAARQGIPADYMEKIASTLERAGLLGAKKGASGGYVLARPAAKIKILEIFNALDKADTKVKCIDAKCSREKNCLAKCLWVKMQAAVNDFLESVTLEDLIKGKI